MILLGVILFGVNKTVTDAAKNPASVPRTAGDEVAPRGDARCGL
jgi:hypothetical protein